MTREQLQTLGARFAAEALPRLVRPAALARLRWHQDSGHRTMVVSASLDIYVEPWARAWGIDEVIASRLQYDHAGRANGILLGGNCWGPEKRARLLQQLRDRERWQVYAYGDSRGDREMLDEADRSYYRYMPSTGAERE
jgi:HAD superfamily hydrolase (TIGR01490 family)